MKKSFMLEELCCANCAAKIEREIGKLEEIKSVSLAFMTQRLSIEVEEADYARAVEKIEKIIKRIEPDCRLVK